MRKRQIVAAFLYGESDFTRRNGAFWSIRGSADSASDPQAVRDLQPPSLVAQCPMEATSRLAAEPTRLKAMPEARIAELMNWGYAKTDIIIRAFYVRKLTAQEKAGLNLIAPPKFPYEGGVGK